MHKIREIREYPPIHVLFSRWKEEKDIVFLDSSLENRLGRYSIIGVCHIRSWYRTEIAFV